MLEFSPSCVRQKKKRFLHVSALIMLVHCPGRPACLLENGIVAELFLRISNIFSQITVEAENDRKLCISSAVYVRPVFPSTRWVALCYLSLSRAMANDNVLVYTRLTESAMKVSYIWGNDGFIISEISSDQ